MLSGFHKSGQKRTNILGEKRMKTVSVFLVLTGKGNWVSVGELTCHLCGNGHGREERAASEVGSLGPGEVLQTVPATPWHCLLVNHGIATKLLCHKTMGILSCVNIFFILTFTLFKSKKYLLLLQKHFLIFELLM